MRRFAHAVTEHPVRILLAWLVAIAAVVALTSPGSAVDRADVMKSDQADFLPGRYESVRAARLQHQGFPAPDGATSTVVIRRRDRAPLTTADIRRAGDLVAGLRADTAVRTIAAPSAEVAPNRKVLLGTVVFRRTAFDQMLSTDVDRLRKRTDTAFARSGLVAGYAGEAATQVDAGKREGVTSMLTMLVILLLLLVLFRSVVVAFFDVLLIALVGATATGLIIIGAKVFGFALDTTVTGLLPIIVLGVGTDYVVFLLHRYRERLRAGDAPRPAMRHAITRIGPAIGFSALTVVVSLSGLALSSLKSLKVLGPALGFGVLATLVAALTLVPAVAVLLRRGLFWPGRSLAAHTVSMKPGRLERIVTGKPAGAAIAAAAVLVAMAVPAIGFTPDYNAETTVPGSPSATAFHAMRAGFPAGALDPTTVMVRKDGAGRLEARDLAPVSTALHKTPGVGAVRPPILSRDGRIAQIDALLEREPFTASALNTIDRRVRPAVARAAVAGTTAEVGGNTSAYADVRDAIKHDQKVIFPVAALLVGGILVLLLHSLAVPLFVMAGVVLGFIATLGASVIAFQGIGGKPGLVFNLPLIVYLFVASMTSDYAILVLARVREELKAGHAPREAVAIALRTAGPSVVAAGFVLAASFAVLIISPSLAQVGFAVAAGILLSSMITARVLIPALAVLGGRRAWWPAHLPAGRASSTPPRTEHALRELEAQREQDALAA
jgi:putative drug exporter of the RND superfamily